MALGACGGGGGSEPPPPPPGPSTTKLQGKVIDGYVSGATVWLDINGNRQRDADEPSATSDSSGNYALALSAAQRECVPYAAMYVDVPVGAVDADSGPVTQAYQMAFPPLLKPIGEQELRHVSPLTTVLWEQLHQRLSDSQPASASCDSLRQSQDLRQKLQGELRTVMGELVSRHNLSEARLYDDFVHAKDQTAHQAAVNIVKGLQAGFAYRHKLQQQYPDARFLRAEVFQGRGTSHLDQKGVWYRSSQVWRPGSYLEDKVVLADDMKTVRQAVHLRAEQEEPWGQGTLSVVRTGWQANSLDPNEFSCVVEERVSFPADTSGLSKLLSVRYVPTVAPVSDPAVCLKPGATADLGITEWGYELLHRGGHISTHTKLFFRPEHAQAEGLFAWRELLGRASAFDSTSLLARMGTVDWRLDAAVPLNPSRWWKRRTDDTGLRVTTERSSDEGWTRQTTQADGTVVKECGKDGSTWGSCS